MSLSQSKYTSLMAAVQPEPEAPSLSLPVFLAAAATEVERRTRHSTRRCHSNHQRVVKDARLLASRAQTAAQCLLDQGQELSRLRAEVRRLEEAADALFWNDQATAWEGQQEDRLFMEACAAEHNSHPGFPAG